MYDTNIIRIESYYLSLRPLMSLAIAVALSLKQDFKACYINKIFRKDKMRSIDLCNFQSE